MALLEATQAAFARSYNHVENALVDRNHFANIILAQKETNPTISL